MTSKNAADAPDQEPTDFTTLAEQAGAFQDGKSPRCSAAEVEARVTAVFEWMTWGWSRPQILQSAAKKWGVRHRQTDDYIRKATERCQEECERTRSAALALADARYSEIYRRALEARDHRTASAAVDSQVRMYGYRNGGTGASPGSFEERPMAIFDFPVKGSMTPKTEEA